MKAILTSKVEIGETELDESQWHNISIFLSTEDPAKLEEIRNLFNKKNIKCKYIIRWRKEDGMVQSKWKHNHEKFAERIWKKCPKCSFESITDVVLNDHCLQKHRNSNRMGDDGLIKLQKIFDKIINREEMVQQPNEQPIDTEIIREEMDQQSEESAASMIKICREMGEKYSKLEKNLEEFVKEISELKKENVKVIEAMEEMCKENSKLKRENKKFERKFAKKNAEIAKLNREHETLECPTMESTENAALSPRIIESNSTAMKGGTLITPRIEMIGSNEIQHLSSKIVNQQRNGPITRNAISNKLQIANAAEIADFRPVDQQIESSLENEADQNNATEMGDLLELEDGERNETIRSQEIVRTSSNAEYGQIECSPLKIENTWKCNWPSCEYTHYRPNKFRWAEHWRSQFP